MYIPNIKGLGFLVSLKKILKFLPLWVLCKTSKILILTKSLTTLIIHCKIQPLDLNTYWKKNFNIPSPPSLPPAPPPPPPPPIHTNTDLQKCKFDLALKRSKVNLCSSFEQTWKSLSPHCYILKFSFKAFLVLEIFKCFLPYMGIATILFNCEEPFEQIGNNFSTEGPCEILWNCPNSFREEGI